MSAEAGRAMVTQDEEVCFDARRHGAALARPLTQAVVLALIGGILLAEPWPLPVPGAALMVVAAAVCLRAVWRWKRDACRRNRRTSFASSTERCGGARRRCACVRSEPRAEQSLPGPLLGYGELVAGPLEIDHVPDPRRLYRLVERLAG